MDPLSRELVALALSRANRGMSQAHRRTWRDNPAILWAMVFLGSLAFGLALCWFLGDLVWVRV